VVRGPFRGLHEAVSHDQVVDHSEPSAGPSKPSRHPAILLRVFYCGCRFGDGKRALTLDHWIPVTLGGGSDLANLRLSCSRCNALKGDTVCDVFVTSARLAARRAVVADEGALASGQRAPRRMYHHP
jgi:5-methylcytosine-specific restriction endonuclease McrA